MGDVPAEEKLAASKQHIGAVRNNILEIQRIEELGVTEYIVLRKKKVANEDVMQWVGELFKSTKRFLLVTEYAF